MTTEQAVQLLEQNETLVTNLEDILVYSMLFAKVIALIISFLIARWIWKHLIKSWINWSFKAPF